MARTPLGITDSIQRQYLASLILYRLPSLFLSSISSLFLPSLFFLSPCFRVYVYLYSSISFSLVFLSFRFASFYFLPFSSPRFLFIYLQLLSLPFRLFLFFPPISPFSPALLNTCSLYPSLPIPFLLFPCASFTSIYSSFPSASRPEGR